MRDLKEQSLKKIDTKKSNIKKNILELVRNSDGVVSGEYIAKKLSISRVSVWKNIKKLIDYGYDIRVTGNGYFIKNSDDFLYPWEFEEFEDKIIYFDTISSTMDFAIKMEIEKGIDNIPDGYVIVAEKQINGRTLSNKNWISEVGGLFFTLISRKKLPSKFAFYETFYSLFSLYNVFKNYFPENSIDIVLPNSIYVNEKKICGILSEQLVSGGLVKVSNIGIGINVNNPINKKNATSFQKELGKNISRREILYKYLKMAQESYKTTEIVNQIKNIWGKKLAKIDNKIVICKDINDLGEVIL